MKHTLYIWSFVIAFAILQTSKGEYFLTEIKSLNNKIEANREKLNDLKKREQTKQRQIVGLQLEEQGLKTQLEGVTAQAECLKTQLEGVTAQAESLQCEKKGLQLEEQGLKTQLEGVIAQAESLQCEKKEISNSISDLENQNKDFETQKSDYQVKRVGSLMGAFCIRVRDEAGDVLSYHLTSSPDVEQEKSKVAQNLKTLCEDGTMNNKLKKKNESSKPEEMEEWITDVLSGIKEARYLLTSGSSKSIENSTQLAMQKLKEAYRKIEEIDALDKQTDKQNLKPRKQKKNRQLI